MDLTKELAEDFKRAKSHFEGQYKKSKEWLSFASGGRGMWKSDLWDARNQIGAVRPCFSLPMATPYIQTISAPVRKNPPSLAVKNVDPNIEAVASGLLRGIEKASRASEAYATAVTNSAICGIGWLRVAIESNEIRIKSESDPTAILIDPQSIEVDGSDALFGFHVGSMDKEEAIERFGKEAGWEKESYELLSWHAPKDSVIDLTYYYIADAFEAGEEGAEGTKIPTLCIERYVGCKKVFEAKIEGCEYIPLIPVYGERSFGNNDYRYQGIVSKVEDLNRALNLTVSSAIELVATAPIMPFIGSIDAIAGHEQHWKNLNTRPPAILPVNTYDSQGQPIQAPQRADNSAQTGGLQAFGDWLTGLFPRTSGISDALLQGLGGANESGEALIQKMDASSSATAEYIDHLTTSISQMGRAIIQMIPYVYSGTRSVVLVDEFGTAGRATTDFGLILTPEIIKELDVEISTGPTLEMERKATASTLTQLAQSMGEKAGFIIPIIAENLSVTNRRELKEAIAQAYPETQKGDQSADLDAVTASAQQTIETQAEALQNLQGIVSQLQAENAQLQTMAEATLQKAQMDGQIKLEDRRMQIEGAYNLELVKQAGLDKRLVAQLTQDDQKELAKFVQSLIHKHSQSMRPELNFEPTPKLPIEIQNQIGKAEVASGDVTSSIPTQE